MTLADSEALRARRARAHKAGDHSLCRRCPAVKDTKPALVQIRGDAQPLDPAAELKELAARQIEAHKAEPGNAMLGRELRMTLQALMPRGKEADGELASLFAELQA